MMDSDCKWMLYGANGYTGRLIAERAVSLGLHPVLAGRNAEQIGELAVKHSLEARVFSLDRPQSIHGQLQGVQLVLNCAGPFAHTARAMTAACLADRTHYLDITGEIPVIEHAHDLDLQARAAGITIIPAVGFDVVPTDCLAAMLAQRLPGAVQLELAFAGGGALSPGTAKTLVLSLPEGGRIRRDGKIVRVPLAWKTREIPFRTGLRYGMTIPWGDVASAYYSTGIPNIRVYIEISPRRAKRLRRLRLLAPLLKFSWAQNIAQQRIAARIKGPSPQQRQRQRTSLWGEVTDSAGTRISATMMVPGGYTLTVRTAVQAVQRVLSGSVNSGFHTPSQAFGAEFILGFEDVDVQFA
jgi:short subunit dehydrogenase-like uncharacterized protein